jgi:methylglyoxal synthase
MCQFGNTIKQKRGFNMEEIKSIALVAHDNRKKDLVEWVEWNYKLLIGHKLICTGTTGKLIEETIKAKLKNEDTVQYEITLLKSGPLGGDQQLGAMIADGKIDLVIFLWDPMQPQPHDVDVKALLRIAVLYNIPTACNRSTADFMISSPLLNTKYEPILNDYSGYIQRTLKVE